jgi:hypothetical protein
VLLLLELHVASIKCILEVLERRALAMFRPAIVADAEVMQREVHLTRRPRFHQRRSVAAFETYGCLPSRSIGNMTCSQCQLHSVLLHALRIAIHPSGYRINRLQRQRSHGFVALMTGSMAFGISVIPSF